MPNCNCKTEVNNLVDGGELRSALMRSSSLQSRTVDAVMNDALNRRAIRTVAVGSGAVRSALHRAGWSANHIDFLLYRSLHDHDSE